MRLDYDYDAVVRRRGILKKERRDHSTLQDQRLQLYSIQKVHWEWDIIQGQAAKPTTPFSDPKEIKEKGAWRPVPSIG